MACRTYQPGSAALADSSEQPESADRPVLGSPRNPVVYVDTVKGLTDAISSLASATGPFALDAERASGFKYSQRAYLIQICRPGSPIFLIDPAAISPDGQQEPFEGLAKLLATDEWLLHAASQDIPCLAMLGIVPTRLFDTELASRLANLERVGLGSVCKSLLGLKLAKEHSAVDWSQRPLADDWLNYAALDVDVLHELRDALAILLESQGKTQWAQQEFDALVRFQSKPPKPDRWRGTSGAIDLKEQQQLAMLKSLWEARESLAQKMDVSPGRILPDRSIIAAIQANPKTKPELASLKTFIGRGSRTFIDIWFAALREGSQARDLPPKRLPQEGIPNHRNWPSKHPEAAARLQKAREAVIAKAAELELPQENLISPDHVRQVCWDLNLCESAVIALRLREAGAREWQIEIVAKLLASCFADSEAQDQS